MAQREPRLKEETRMWIDTVTVDRARNVKLLCDECGAIFEDAPADDRRTYWRKANVAGWVRTARAPERHVCANC